MFKGKVIMFIPCSIRLYVFIPSAPQNGGLKSLSLQYTHKQTKQEQTNKTCTNKFLKAYFEKTYIRKQWPYPQNEKIRLYVFIPSAPQNGGLKSLSLQYTHKQTKQEQTNKTCTNKFLKAYFEKTYIRKQWPYPQNEKIHKKFRVLNHT